jgi:uncharacterized membrane protein
MTQPLIQSPMAVLTVLLAVLSLLFLAERHPVGARVFKVLPILVLVYFVPTLLSNTGIIPTQSELYEFVRKFLLPASLVLLVLAVDVPAIFRLGRNAVVPFLAGTVSIILGGPLAYLALGWLVPAELGEQAWKGLAALSGSWIGGGANFVAIGQSVGVEQSTIGMMVVVDVGVANVWTAVLLYFAGREKEMDARMGADRRALDAVREEVERFQAAVARPPTLADLVWISVLGLGTTVACTALAERLPNIGTIVTGFTWVVILVTTVGVALSFTPARRLEGAGASRVGTLFLYVLVMTIGAQAEFRQLLQAPALVAVGAVWMVVHAIVILVVRRVLRAPIFFAAVGSQANVGGGGFGFDGGGGLPPGARSGGRHAGGGRLRAGHLWRAVVRGPPRAGAPAHSLESRATGEADDALDGGGAPHPLPGGLCDVSPDGSVRGGRGSRHPGHPQCPRVDRQPAPALGRGRGRARRSARRRGLPRRGGAASGRRHARHRREGATAGSRLQ